MTRVRVIVTRLAIAVVAHGVTPWEHRPMRVSHARGKSDKGLSVSPACGEVDDNERVGGHSLERRSKVLVRLDLLHSRHGVVAVALVTLTIVVVGAAGKHTLVHCPADSPAERQTGVSVAR